jgi:creatinine amidohydrolase/Fe(II)-dependent formamide hydrolase-like protein
MKLAHMHAALTLLLLAATIGSVSRHAGDTTLAQPADAVAAAQCAAVAAARTGDEARSLPPVPVNGSIEANELPNQLAVLFEYIGLFPNEMATPAAAAVE